MDTAKHAEHSSSKLAKGHESIGQGRGLRKKNGFAESLVDHGAVAEYALKQRSQHPEIKQAFRDVQDQHARRPIERLSADRRWVEKGAERGGPDPCEAGAALLVQRVIRSVRRDSRFLISWCRGAALGAVDAGDGHFSVGRRY